MLKNLPAIAGDIRNTGLIPGSERSPGGGNGNPLQYSCLENPLDRGLQSIVLQKDGHKWRDLACLLRYRWEISICKSGIKICKKKKKRLISLINSLGIINQLFEKKIKLDNCIPYKDKFQIEQRLSIKIKLLNKKTKSIYKGVPYNI